MALVYMETNLEICIDSVNQNYDNNVLKNLWQYDKLD